MSQNDTLATDGLGKAVKKSGAWILTGRGIITLLMLGSSVVLARLLEPADFGMFGIAIIFTGLATRFGNVGFGLALVQRKEIHDDHVSSLFVSNLVMFFALAGLLNLAAPCIGALFDSPLTGRVVGADALVFLTAPFSSVSRVLMQRRMDFKNPTLGNITDHFVSATTAVVLALMGCGVWSLVGGHLLGTLAGTIMLVSKSGWRPRLCYRHSAMKDLYAFGAGIFVKNLLIYGADKIDYFIIGKVLGPAALGFYEKAFNLMDLAVKELSTKMSMMLFSAFSKIQDDQQKIRKAYSKVIMTLSLLCFPVFSGLILVAPTFVTVVFGEKWLPSALPLQILCIAGIFRMHLQVTSTIVNALGKVAVEIWRRTAALVLLTIGCWLGSFWGITGVAVAVTVTTAILAVTMVGYLNTLTGLTWYDGLQPQGSAFTASVVMAGTAFIYQRWAEGTLGAHSASLLFSTTMVGASVYIITLWILRPSPVVALAKEFLTAFRPAARGVTR
jgi:O-antigen/teichoic acid export membrane protein